MTKHTPGPWEIAFETFDNDGAPETAIQALGGRAFVAFALEFGPNNPQMREANARLIAAAPDLLEALKKIVKSLADQDDEGMIEHVYLMIKARAAITKATGEEA